MITHQKKIKANKYLVSFYNPTSYGSFPGLGLRVRNDRKKGLGDVYKKGCFISFG